MSQQNINGSPTCLSSHLCRIAHDRAPATWLRRVGSMRAWQWVPARWLGSLPDRAASAADHLPRAELNPCLLGFFRLCDVFRCRRLAAGARNHPPQEPQLSPATAPRHRHSLPLTRTCRSTTRPPVCAAHGPGSLARNAAPVCGPGQPRRGTTARS